jgi:type IV conjugative transfer system protein TraL
MYSSNSILKHINKPSKIIFWDLDEALSFLVPFGLLCVTGQVLLGTALGFFVFCFLRFIKQQFGIASISHAAYWYLPTAHSRFKVPISSYKREYIG